MPAPIRFGIFGVGNCASALIQGITYYSRILGRDKQPLGLIFEGRCTESVTNMMPVCAFDVDRRKVGLDLSAAILHPVITAEHFCPDLEPSGCCVEEGILLDGLAPTNTTLAAGVTADAVPQNLVASDHELNHICDVIRKAAPDMMVNFLPVGSTAASRFYAEACLRSGVSFINCIPVPLTTQFFSRYATAGLVFLGDDIKSQFGATIVHRVLMALADMRGVQVTKTYQLNVGGNSDFENMADRTRLADKRRSKTESVISAVRRPPPSIHISPSDHVPFLKDTKIAFVRIEGKQFGDLPFSLDLRLEVQDSPNSAGVVIEAIRAVALAKSRGLCGYLDDVGACLFKSPRVQCDEFKAYEAAQRFFAGEHETA